MSICPFVGVIKIWTKQLQATRVQSAPHAVRLPRSELFIRRLHDDCSQISMMYGGVAIYSRKQTPYHNDESERWLDVFQWLFCGTSASTDLYIYPQ